ncbi:lipocalin-like domain-containing protein [Aestuariivirga sp.]|uniref:lipocalin-like domain-containing protein n=1 Tax=Aestuariivirga sp. TaxID=2650926 RepID=UPI0025BE007C|nr:lipocalin-like domain-containing protein [Aestuariivirga sp.]MCA3556423.1 iron ABC transporter permease [Aestuariivirga sp.]
MNVRLLLLMLLMMAAPALAQGFAGLGGDAQGFAVPRRGQAPQFPRDHGAHPDYRIEWWYLTANLKGEDGKDYGAQWTLFRSALAPEEKPGWQSPQLWMGHAALTTGTRHYSDERLARGGVGQAGVTLSPFSAAIDDWSMTSRAAPPADELSALAITAAGEGFSYALALDARGPLVRQGEEGYSVKSAQGQASYYYSQPFYAVTGAIAVEGKDIAVTGQAWFDHEWSSQPLSKDQTGWDWFSFHFDAGAKLMGFRLRDAGGGFTSATWINADGTPEPQPPGALEVSPLAWAEVKGHRVPVQWKVSLPAKGIEVTTAPVNEDAWMETQVAYWEGPVRIEGTHPGVGYVEMTGY